MDGWTDGLMVEILWSVCLRYCSDRQVCRYVGMCVDRKIDFKKSAEKMSLNFHQIVVSA
jgi:hypothetical protein